MFFKSQWNSKFHTSVKTFYNLISHFSFYIINKTNLTKWMIRKNIFWWHLYFHTIWKCVFLIYIFVRNNYLALTKGNCPSTVWVVYNLISDLQVIESCLNHWFLPYCSNSFCKVYYSQPDVASPSQTVQNNGIC